MICKTSYDANLQRLLCTPIVHLLVGESKRRFSIHRGLLRRHSLTIRDMLRRQPPRENNENIVLELPDFDVTAFAVFAEWIYVGAEADSGDVLVDAEGKDVTKPDGENFIGKIDPRGDAALRKEALEEAKAKKKGDAAADERDSESRTLVGDEDEACMEGDKGEDAKNEDGEAEEDEGEEDEEDERED